MTFYKLRHRPTGLFFKPNRSPYQKCNLSNVGKTYNKKPSLGHLGKFIYTGKDDPNNYYRSVKLQVIPADWEICVYETILKDVISCG